MLQSGKGQQNFCINSLDVYILVLVLVLVLLYTSYLTFTYFKFDISISVQWPFTTQIKCPCARWVGILVFAVPSIEIMFKFNFITENDDKKDVIDNGKGELIVWEKFPRRLLMYHMYKNIWNSVSESTTELKPVNKYDECFEIVPTKEQEKIDYFAPNLVATFNCIIFQNDHRVYHIPIDDIIDKLAEGSDDISCAEQNHSDLIAGVYEGKITFSFFHMNLYIYIMIIINLTGGAKVWECTETVGEYLTKTDCGKCLINEFREKICLDLGCGAGILGILALNNGASVHFQDYVRISVTF